MSAPHGPGGASAAGAVVVAGVGGRARNRNRRGRGAGRARRRRGRRRRRPGRRRGGRGRGGVVVADRVRREDRGDDEHDGDDPGEHPAPGHRASLAGRARRTGLHSRHRCRSRSPDLATDLAFAHALADAADVLTMAPVPSRRPRGRDQARPHAGHRGRPRGRGDDPRPARATTARATRCWARSSAPPGPVGRRWIVDPIDGTKGYARGIPVWATLIALEVDGDLVAGVVSAPALGSRWSAARGQGAQRDGEPVTVSKVARIEDAHLAYDSVDAFESVGLEAEFLALARRCWRVRGFGDFWAHMLVADGSIDIAVEVGGLEGVGSRCGVGGRRGGGWALHRSARRVAHRRRRRDLDQRVGARRRGRRVRAVALSASRQGDGMGTEVTVGIDIGTSSVKAIAADGDGNVVARARVAHEVRVPAPERFEHDAAVAWHDGPLRALAELGDLDVRGVSVAAMVPSLTAVDGTGTPLTPGSALRRRPWPHRRIGRRRRRHRRRVGWVPRVRPLAGRGGAGRARPLARAGGRQPRARAARRCSTRPPPRSRTPCSTGSGGTSSSRTELGIRTAQLPAPRAHRVGGGPHRRRRARARVGVHRRDGRAARGRGRPAG